MAIKVGDEVLRNPERNYKFPFGKVITEVPGGFEVRWDDGNGNKEGAITYYSAKELKPRYEDEPEDLFDN